MQVRSLVKIGGVLAAIAVLLAVGVVIAVKSVNLDQVKAMLTNQVKNATGRTLTIAGPLELQAGLVPVLVAHGVTLSNPAGSTRPDMIRIDHVEMEMALMPLFKREILVNRLIVSSPDILIETEAEGVGNLDFRHPTGPSEPKSPDVQKEGTGYQFNLNELTITNALVAWHDRTSNKTESAAIKELTLSPDPADAELLAIGLQTTVREQKIVLSGTVGRLAAAFDDQPWPINLKAHIQGLTMSAEGSVIDLAAFSGIKVKIDGQGAELMEVVRLAGVTTPDLPQSVGPFKVSAHLSDAGKQLNLTDVVVGAGKRELVLLQAKGAVHDLAGTAAVDLAVNMESDNPSVAAKLAGVDMSGKGQVALTGQLRGSDTAWKVNDLNLNATIDGSKLNVQGSVADLASLSGIKVKIDGQGTELMEVVRLAGMTTPDLPQSVGSFKVSAHLSDTGKRLNLTDVVVEAGKPALLLLNAKGTVKDVTGTAAVDLAVNLESDNPQAVVELAGGGFSGKGPLKLVGQLRGSGTTWKMTDFKSSVGGSDLSGELTTSFTARPRLSGKLTSSTLHLADFTTTTATAAPAQSGPQSAQAKRDDGRIFSDQPLPVAPLRSVDADLSVQAAKLILDDRQLTDVTVVLQLNAGRLAINPFRFGLAGGVIEGEATLDATGTTPIAALRMNGRQVELGKIDSKGPIIGGKSDLQVDLKSSGESIRALMAAATGESSLSVGEGRLRSKAVDRAAGDLLFQVVGAINPFTRSEDTTQMTCAAVRFVIRDGIATADNGIAMRTSQVDVMGSGTVDLRTEKLDIGIRPRSRGGVGLSLSTPLGGLVRVGGTIAKPTIGIDAAGTLRTAASVGAGIATGGLSTVGEMLVSRVTADEDPCRTALGQPQQGQSTPTTERQNLSPESLLRGLFGR